MRKHLFSFIAAVGVLFAGAGTAWADTTVTLGLNVPVTSYVAASEVSVLPEPTVDGLTVTWSDGSNANRQTSTTSTRSTYSGNSTAISTPQSVCYQSTSGSSKTKITARTEDLYIGYDVTLRSGYYLSLSSLDVKVAMTVAFSYQIEIYQITGETSTKIYTSSKVTSTNYKSDGNTLTAKLSSDNNLQNLTGNLSIRLYYWPVSASDSKYIVPLNVTVTGTLSNTQPSCEAVTFLTQYDFKDKVSKEVLSTTTPKATIYYTTDADSDNPTYTQYSSPIEITSTTNIKAYASADGYSDSEPSTSGSIEVAAYDTEKSYVAWIYEDSYKDGTFTYAYADDPMYQKVSASYNVVPVAYSMTNDWSDVCPTLNSADVIVITDAITGAGALCKSLSGLADGSNYVINMKAYGYGDGRWGWGTASNQASTIAITPGDGSYKLFNDLTKDEAGTYTLFSSTPTSGNLVQTVTLGSGAPSVTKTIATANDAIAIHTAPKYLFIGLSSNNYKEFNNNAAQLLKNAVDLFVAGSEAYVLNPTGTCATPEYQLSALDMSTYTYTLSLISVDDAAIYYTLNGGTETLYENALTLKRGDVVVAVAKAKEGETRVSSELIEITAPNLSGEFTETPGVAAKDDKKDYAGTCFTIVGDPYVAGTGNNNVAGVKLRVNKSVSNNELGFRINVNKGCIIQKIVAVGSGNTGAFTLNHVYVDGSSVNLLPKSVAFEKVTDNFPSVTVENLNATEYIDFAGTLDDGNQANFQFTFTYVIPEDPTILHTVTFSDAVEGYATFCPAKNVLIPEGVTAYIAKAEDGALTLSEVEKYIPANTGVILKGTAGETAEFETTGFTADVTGNELTGVTKETTVEAKSVYVLSAEGDEGVGFFVFSGTTIPANKAYYKAPAASTISALHFNFGETEEPGNVTGINAVAIENNAQQVIYDLRGRRVQSLDRPGLYIVNGKKVAIQ